MKIKKTFQGELPENRIVNTYSNSLTDAYSANYLNDKLKSVEVSSTEPTNDKDIWVQMGKNLFDKNSCLISGKYLASDGSLGDDTTLFYQETYIPVEPNTSYVISNANNENHRICEYDANKTFLTRFLNDNSSLSCIFTSGPSTKFIRISCRIDNIDSLQIEQGEFKTDYEPYIPKKIYVKKDGKYELVYDEANTRKEVYVGPTEPKSGEKVWIKKSNNLFPGWNVGRHYGSSNGSLTFDTDNSSTDLIPVDFTTNNKYTFSNFPTSSNIYISAFDSKGVYVGRTASGIKSEYTFTPDKLSSSGAGSGDANDIKYIAVTYQGTDVTNNTMLNMGGDVLPYEERVNTEILTKNDNGVYEGVYKKLNNERHIMYAYVSAETDIVTGADQRAKVPLNKFEFVGTKLSFNADKKSIIIGKGVSKIAIRGILSYKDDLGSVPIALNLFHNGSSLTQRFETTSSSTRSFALIESELPILSVSEGDIISLVLRTVATTNKTVHIYDGKSSSMLCVEVLE